MPITKRKTAPKRKKIAIPEPMVNEVDRIVYEHPELHYSRQSFIESGIREKIEKIWLIEKTSKVEAQPSAE